MTEVVAGKGLCARLFGSAWFGLILAVLALLLTSSAIGVSFFADDHLFLAADQGFPGLAEYSNGPLETFVFSEGDPARNRERMDRGLFPWWGLPEGRLSFFRPLASITHWLDLRIFGRDPVPMQAQNLVWYAGLAVVVFGLYRRLVTPAWAAGLAGLLYAIDNGHGIAVGWISSRNSLMTAFFVAATVYTHDQWRRGGARACGWAAAALFTAGLASGEAAMAGTAYLFAHAVFLDSGPLRRRLIALAPYAGIAAGYLLLYKWFGFGTAGSAWYTDPVGEPIAFAQAVLERLPVLVTTQWLEWPLPALRFIPWGGSWLGRVLLAAICGGIVVLLVPLLKRNREARFWLAGMLLSLVISCSVVPQPRLLLIGGIGGMALVGQFLGGVWGRAAWVPRRWAWRVPAYGLVAVWVVAHALIGPYFLPVTSRSPRGWGGTMDSSLATIPWGPACAGQTFVFLKMPSDFMTWYFPVIRASNREAIPARVRMLAAGERDVAIERVDRDALLLRREGSFSAAPQFCPFRSARNPMRPGDTVAVEGMTVTVTETDGTGWPIEALFRFDRPLEDPSLVWLTYIDERKLIPALRGYRKTPVYVSIQLPGIGERASLDELAAESREELP